MKTKDNIRIRPTPLELQAHYALMATGVGDTATLHLLVKHGALANWGIALPKHPLHTMLVTIHRGDHSELPGTSTYNIRAGDLVWVLMHGSYPPKNKKVVFETPSLGWKINNMILK